MEKKEIIQLIENKIEYHSKKEQERSKVGDYVNAMRHSERRAALKDLHIEILLKEHK